MDKWLKDAEAQTVGNFEFINPKHPAI
jgi:hypothetical protein